MAEFVTLEAGDGHSFPAWRAAPEGAPKGAVVVIQEIFGVNHQIRSATERFAANGYLAIAPAIQHRLEPGFETDAYTPESQTKIRALMKDFDPAKALLDVAAAIAAVSDVGKVGITGYCLGGRITWMAASQLSGLSAASGYYGGGVPNYIDMSPKVPAEMHFGEEDANIPLEQVEELRKKHPDVDFYLYPAGHGFFNDERERSYHRESGEKAFARTLDFFAKHIAA